MTEGDDGDPTNLTFRATLSAASDRQVTVDYADAGTGTATSGTDYTAITGGTLTFPAGTTSQTFNVSVTGDTDVESNETVVATLGNPTIAGPSGTPTPTIATATGTGTITDNDAPPSPSLSIDSPRVTEGDAGETKNLTFTVTLSPANAGQQVTVAYADAATGTATSGTDYTAITAGTLTFPAGTTSQTFNVSVTGDGVFEPSETVVVTLSGATNATIATATGTGTITNDDADTPVVVFNPTALTLAEEGAGKSFTVALASDPGPGRRSVLIDVYPPNGFRVAGITGTTTATLKHGDDPLELTVDALADANTWDETRYIRYRTYNYGPPGRRNGVTVTAIDDDRATASLLLSRISPPPTTPPSSVDGKTRIPEDGGVARVTATLDKTSPVDTRITVSGTVAFPDVPGDFTLSSAKTLTIAAGETTSTGEVTITANHNVNSNRDDKDPGKYVTVRGTVSHRGVTPPDPVTLMILDDDRPTVSIDSPSVTEGDSGSTNLTFTVTLSVASGQQVTVDYADAGAGTAMSGTDYTAITGGTLTFAAGDDQPDLHRGGDRRYDRRGGRDRHGDPGQPGERDRIEYDGHRRRHDHGRRRSPDAVHRLAERDGGRRRRHDDPDVHGDAERGERQGSDGWTGPKAPAARPRPGPTTRPSPAAP